MTLTTALEVNTEISPVAPFQSQPLELVSPDEARIVLATSISVDSQPCLFKLGNAFYDFTPFKLVSNLWATQPTNSQILGAEHMQYNFTWCQLISETTNVTSY